MRPYSDWTNVIRRTLLTLNILIGTTLTAMQAYEVIKPKVQEFGETEKVATPLKYVLVRLARGDYNNRNGFEQIQYDYKFFDISTKIKDKDV